MSTLYWIESGPMGELNMTKTEITSDQDRSEE